jgi:hypothetical protein
MLQIISRSLLFSLILCGLSVLTAPVTRAQDLDDVTISGRVLDTNNAAIPGAKVTAKLESTGAERSTTTDTEGRYRLIELGPGIYTVTVTAKGFAENKFTKMCSLKYRSRPKGPSWT